jgi:hypothetical protein
LAAINPLMIKKPFVDTDEFSDLISGQLKGIKNIELLILKGHVLVEYALNKYIDAFSHTDISIEDSRFSFAQKLDVCRILGLIKNSTDHLNEQLVALNKIRNQIAHTLTFDHKTLEQIFKHHPQEVQQFKSLKEDTKNIKVLSGIIPWLCGNIIGRLETKQTIDKAIREIGVQQIRKELKH